MKKTVLCYSFDGEELDRLQRLCERRGASLRAVKPGEYALPLGSLAAGEGEKKAVRTEAPIRERMMVFAGFEEGDFDAFLEELRLLSLGSGALKAVLTHTNAAWNSAELFRELQREREEFFRLRAGRAGYGRA